MKKSTTFLFAAIALILLINGFNANAASSIRLSKPAMESTQSLVYKRSLNPLIGITPDANAKGSSYTVVDENGKIVFSGKIKSSDTFYIPTNKLGEGYFTFYINNFMVQQFVVN